MLIEVGGTVGDIESLPFLEAIRQFKFDEDERDVLFLHLTSVPYLGTSHEFKTKPTQHSVAALRLYGISPDIVMVRSKEKLPPEITRKIAQFTSVRENRVFSSYDVSHVYEWCRWRWRSRPGESGGGPAGPGPDHAEPGRLDARGQDHETPRERGHHCHRREVHRHAGRLPFADGKR